MSRWNQIIVVLLALWMGFAPCARASIKSYRSLSADEKTALAQSERRLQLLDQALTTLERSHAQKKISNRDYAYWKSDLTVYISVEAKFQDEMLIKPPGLSDDKKELLEDIAGWAVLVPAILATVGAICYCHGTLPSTSSSQQNSFVAPVHLAQGSSENQIP